MTDETENKQDTSQTNADSSGGTQGTSQQEPTISKSEHEAAIQKAVSDALAKAGRDDKSLKAREDAILNAEKSISDFNKQRDEEEIAAAKGDKSIISAIERRRQLRDQEEQIAKQRRDIESREAAISVKEQESSETKLAVDCWIAAQEAKVDPTTLQNKAKLYGIKDAEALKDLAKTLAGSNQSGGGTGGEGGESNLHEDSGGGSGSGEPTVEQLAKASMDDFAKWYKKRFPSSIQ